MATTFIECFANFEGLPSKQEFKPSGIDAGPDRIWLQEKVAEFFGGFDPIQIRFVGDTLVRLLTRVAGNGLFTVRPTPELSWPTWGLRCYKYQCADKSSSPSTRSNF